MNKRTTWEKELDEKDWREKFVDSRAGREPESEADMVELANTEALRQVKEFHSPPAPGGAVQRKSEIGTTCLCGHLWSQHSIQGKGCLVEKCACVRDDPYSPPTYKGAAGYSHGGSWSWESEGKGYGLVGAAKWCAHRPTKIIDGRNWSVWAASLSKARAAKRDFNIVINCTGSSLFEQGHTLPHELQEFVVAPKAEEILLDWEDGADINLTPEFWPALVEYLRTKKAKTLVHCLGGHGRTGTAAACLLVAACDYGANQAIKWIRKNYCEEAIETIAQLQYVRQVAKALKEKKDSRKHIPPKKE